MGFNVGDLVEWKVRIGEDKPVIERAGEIIAVIEPFTHPKELGFKTVSPNVAVREEESYLIRIPKWDVIFWPGIKSIIPLSPDRTWLLEDQKTPTSTVLMIDKRDRMKLIKFCKDFGFEFHNSKDFLTVPEWGKRFTFTTTAGLEWVSSVEILK